MSWKAEIPVTPAAEADKALAGFERPEGLSEQETRQWNASSELVSSLVYSGAIIQPGGDGYFSAVIEGEAALEDEASEGDWLDVKVTREPAPEGV